jgi:hypothetical protein
MMVKEASVPRAETFLRRENSIDGLKVKTSQQSLSTPPDNLVVKNGLKTSTAKPPVSNSQPAGTFPQNTN